MGCTSSSQASSGGESRPEELVKCSAVSAEVRWSWLRGHTLFTFPELRALFLTFSTAAATSSRPMMEVEQQQQQQGKQSGGGASSSAAAPISSVSSVRSSRHHGAPPPAAAVKGITRALLMNKAQFTSLCEGRGSTGTCSLFGLPDVVGAFAPRLFDVLDVDGDGCITFETFAAGMSKLLKGPDSEKLKLLYAAYDISGVAPSEERRQVCDSFSGSCRSLGGSGGGGKSKAPRRSKYLTLEDITAVLVSASQVAVYPTLLNFTTEGGAVTTSYLSGSGTGDGGLNGCSCRGGDEGEGEDGGEGGEGRGQGGGTGESKSTGTPPPLRIWEANRSPSSQERTRNRSFSTVAAGGGAGAGAGHGRTGSYSRPGGGSGRSSRDPEALAQLLGEIARRNAADYAAQAVSKFGQSQNGKALTQKEFERWALTGPVLRCRINEFSIDLNLAPFQGVRLV